MCALRRQRRKARHNTQKIRSSIELKWHFCCFLWFVGCRCVLRMKTHGPASKASLSASSESQLLPSTPATPAPHSPSTIRTQTGHNDPDDKKKDHPLLRPGTISSAAASALRRTGLFPTSLSIPPSAATHVLCPPAARYLIKISNICSRVYGKKHENKHFSSCRVRE